MTPKEFQKVQERYRQEPVLFFFSLDMNDTGYCIATEYTRDEMLTNCIAAFPLSEFAFQWNDGYEVVPNRGSTWMAVSPSADAKGGGIYNTRYEEKLKE